MKNIYTRACAFLTLLFVFSGCGVAEHMGRSCGGDLKELCYNIVGGRNDSREDDSIARLKDKVTSLENQIINARYQLITINSALAGQSAVSAGLTSTVTALNATVNSSLMQIAVLQGYNNIVSLKDPCGAQGNVWNEVFLKLSSGVYIASFSDNASGLNTRFTVLKDGSYVTTDQTNCFFTVSGNGTVISNEHN
jgi:hypothetical protein